MIFLLNLNQKKIFDLIFYEQTNNVILKKFEFSSADFIYFRYIPKGH